MLFPISDDDRNLPGLAPVSILFLVANVCVFLYQMQVPEFTYGYSLVPQEITTGVDLVGDVPIEFQGSTQTVPHAPGPSPLWLTLLTSMFMHGGIAHLGGNMLYLWIFGDNVEHRFGTMRFVFFYVVSGIAGTLAQIALAPDSIIPNLGASGAISGILGAYLVLFPKNKVQAIFIIRVVSLPAIIVIGLWAAMQIFGGFGSIAGAGQTGGVAYMAHIGGFVAGVIAAFASKGFTTQRETTLSRAGRRDPQLKDLFG